MVWTTHNWEEVSFARRGRRQALLQLSCVHGRPLARAASVGTELLPKALALCSTRPGKVPPVHSHLRSSGCVGGIGALVPKFTVMAIQHREEAGGEGNPRICSRGRRGKRELGVGPGPLPSCSNWPSPVLSALPPPILGHPRARLRVDAGQPQGSSADLTELVTATGGYSWSSRTPSPKLEQAPVCPAK